MKELIMTAPFTLPVVIIAAVLLIPGMDSDPALREMLKVLLWVWALSIPVAMLLRAACGGSRYRR